MLRAVGITRFSHTEGSFTHRSNLIRSYSEKQFDHTKAISFQRIKDLDIKAIELVRADIVHKFCGIGCDAEEDSAKTTELLQLQNTIEVMLRRLKLQRTNEGRQ